jgi:DNA-binding CsgD family transcriptional regulator
VPDAGASLQLFCNPFIGRAGELAALAAVRREAARGHGALVLIGGEAGIGKSRLLREFAAGAGNSRVRAFTIACLPFAQAPFAAVTEALRALHASMPEVVRRHPADFSGLDAANGREQRLRAIAHAFTLYARHRAVSLIFEDIHWADNETLEILQLLAQQLAGTKLLTIATYRTEAANEKTPLVAALGGLARHRTVHRLELSALSPALTRRLARATLEGAHAALPQNAVAAVVERSEGNPFFAEELLRSALLSSGTDGVAELPLTIRGLVAERLAMFSDADAALLARAAVLGRRFSAQFLGKLAGRARADVLTHLRQARDAQLIVEVGDAGTFAFRHALIREAIGASLLAVDARALHAEIVGALEDQPDAEAAELAFHAWASGDRARTLRYNEEYGDAALAVRANGEAAVAYGRALGAADDVERRFRLNLKLGDAAAAAGYPESASAALADALAGRPAIDDATYERVFLSLTAQVLNAHVDPTPIIERESRSFAAPSPAIVRVFRTSRALAALYRGRFAEALALTQPLDLAGDAHLFGGHALARVTALAALCERDHWKAEHELWLLGSEQLADPLRRSNASLNSAIMACALADGERAAELFPAAVDKFVALKTPSYLALAYSFHAYEHFLRGRLTRARECVEAALDAEHEAHFSSVHVTMAALLIGLALEDQAILERVDRDALQRGLAGELHPSYASVAGPYAFELASRGQHRVAAAMLGNVAAKLTSSYGCALTAVAIAELAELDVAADVRAIFARDAQRPGDWVMQAIVPLFDAIIAERRGEMESSREHAHVAAERLRSLQYPLLEARALELAGMRERALELYVRCGDVRNARRLQTPPGHAFSSREREISGLVAGGASNREIATALSISERTVEKHLHTMFGKLGVHSRTQLIHATHGPQSQRG